MSLDTKEIDMKTKGNPGGNHMYFKVSRIQHMAKVAMVTPRFPANKVDPGLHFILKFRYMKHNSHDHLIINIFVHECTNIVSEL